MKESQLTAEQVGKLASIGCTDNEICAVAEISQRTLARRFAAVLRKGREEGKVRLRQLQMKAAQAGNVAMLIFLGKNILGQRDNPDIEIKPKDLPKLRIEVLRSGPNAASEKP
jgi:hypothetical protein